MAKRTVRRGPGRPKGSGVKGHELLLVRLRPEQRAAILALAEGRRKPGKAPPISEVVRELLDKALKATPRARRK